MAIEVRRFRDRDSGDMVQMKVRVMNTTCPLCHKGVQFSMQDDDFVSEQLQEAEQHIKRLYEKLRRKDEIIAALSRRINEC
jgi:hypothetical protein